MTITTIARRAALDAFVLGGLQPADGPLPLRAAEPSQYLSGQRLRLAREALAVLRARPNERLDVEALAAAVAPRIIELVGTGAIRL